MINQRKALRTAYPDILTLSDITKILKISKRKAAWMLQNGYIKNINSGKKTRQYQVRINDLFEYMRISNFIKHSVGKNIYKGMVESRIVPYFKETSLTLKDITGEDLNAYYAYLLNSGLKGITAQKHHALLHLAFKHAVKHRIIPTNPCDQANRPKSEKYIADYYNADKLKQLLNSLEGDPMRIVVILTIYYGLRRSEVLGLKWSAIDFKEKRIHICHKIIEDKTSGKTVIRGLDVMKSKSSFRSLPLIPFVEEELIKEKEKQEEMQRVLRKTYNRSYLEYVCVNPLGNIIKPQYVTEHFKVLLRKHGMDQIRFHDLRHSCATLMLSNHEEMKKIQAWLGHSTITITADTYTHLDMSGKVTSAEKIATSLEMLAT